MSDLETTQDDQHQAKPRVITLVGVVALAALVYEITHQPALGTAVLCLKFGWEDWKTAFWLARVDPWRARGKALWWLHIARGLWRAAATAVVVNFVLLGLFILAGVFWVVPQGRGIIQDGFMFALLSAWATMFVGFALTSIAAMTAAVIAYRNRFQLWLDDSANVARRCNTWPPLITQKQYRNRLLIIYVTTLFPVGACFVVYGVILAERWHIPNAELIVAIAFCVLLSVFAQMLIAGARLVEAKTPFDTWIIEVPEATD